MYQIDIKALDLFTKQYLQAAEIRFEGTEESTVITEKDLLSGGLSINRYSVSSEKIEIGSAVASELSLNLNNASGKFDNITFEGAELFVQICIEKWDAHKWENAQRYKIPMGYFIVDSPPRKLEAITLQALDRMALFDVDADNSLLTFPTRIDDLLTRICEICGVTLAINPSILLNADYVVNYPLDDEDLTYRQYLSWIAEITATCAFMDYKGELVLAWYGDTPSAALTTANRFDSDLQENAVTLSGIQIINGEDKYLSGTDDYALVIENNPLIQHNFADVADIICESIAGFSYTPYSAVIAPMPHLYPLDSITFTDRKGNEHFSIITDYTFTLNKNTSVAGQGETNQNNSYASTNPFTRRETAIIRALQESNNEVENTRIQTALAFNELISNALGMYMTALPTGNGSNIYYLHDKELLSESLTIFTMTSEGIAWTTTGWNDGNPDWSRGVTSAGDALFRTLSAEGIEVSNTSDDFSVKITPRAFNIYYRQMLVTSITNDTMNIPKAKVSECLEVGNIQIAPYVLNGETIGANIVFIEEAQ